MALSKYSVKTLYQATNISRENTRIVTVNPLHAQSWVIIKDGGHPQTSSIKYLALLFQHSLRINDIFTVLRAMASFYIYNDDHPQANNKVSCIFILLR
jgi:hypothetical protein